MLRISIAIFGLALVSILGCGQAPPAGDKPNAVVADPRANAVLAEPDRFGGPVAQIAQLSPEEIYAAALADAFRLMAEQKNEEALAKLREAAAAQKSDYIDSEIARLESQLRQKSVAEKTAADIRTILESGNPSEASRLAGDALLQFGDSDVGITLTSLKKQSDAILSVSLDDAGKKQRFKDEALQALEAKNVRAALVAYDQAVANGVTDADFKAKFEPVRGALRQYEENRDRGVEFRRDSAKLDLALESFQNAQKVWPTPQIQQDIQETQLAINNRRDVVAIGNFEIVGDVGIPNAGQAIAEELLPHFRARFDVVERSQIAKVADELKLGDANWSNDVSAFSQVGKLVKARYMVVGSVSKIFGTAVNARMVDVNTGLVVQTAKIVAGTPEELVGKLPKLAKILQMNDQEKMAYEREIAQAETIQPAPIQAAIPAPPPAAPPAGNTTIVNAAPGSTVIINSGRPPEYGILTAADFNGQAAIPQPGPVVIVEAPQPIRQRSIFVALEIGDDLFRRHRFAEALRQYEFALSLAPDIADIRVRIDNCRPFVGFAPVVVVNALPRLAVLPFAEFGNPYVIPPGLGVWTADNMAYQFSGMYEVVDRGELFWWMGRLGLTVRDVALNPSARLCLARAMNVRFFLLGCLQETASFDVSTNLLDVEANAQIGSARMHVQNQFELKCRLQELTQMTVMPPQQRVVYVQQQVVVRQRVTTAEVHIKSGKFNLAIGVYKDVLVEQPNNTEILVALREAEYRQRQWELEEARRQAWEAEQTRRRAEEERGFTLTIRIEGERRKAERGSVDLTAQQNQINQGFRLKAQQDLLGQARNYLRNGQYQESLNAYMVAYNTSPNDAILQEMAVARQQADASTRARNEQFAANALFSANQQQQQQVARIAPLLQQQQAAQVVAVQQSRQAFVQRDDGEYRKLLDAGQRAQAAGNLKQAVAAYQAARRLKPTDEADRLVNAATVELARQEATAKGDAERRALEAQLAQETAKRQIAEAEAARNKEKYQTALRNARAALASKQLDQAESNFKLASMTVHTDEADAGLRQVRDERAKLTAAADAERKKNQEEARKQADYEKQLAAGKAAANTGNHAQAVMAFRQAAALKPADTTAQAELIKAQQMQEKAKLDAVAKIDSADLDKKNKLALEARIAQAKAATDAKAMADAKSAADAKAGTDARVLAEAKAMQLKKDADLAASRNAADTKMKADQDARLAMAKKDAEAKAAQDAKLANEAKMAADAKMAQAKKDADAKLKSDQDALMAGQQSAKLKGFVDAARQAVAAKRYDSAEGLLAEARKVNPNDPSIAAAAKDIADGKAAMAKAASDGKAAADSKAAAQMAAQVAAQETAKKQQAYNDAMQKGRDSYSKRGFDEAIAHFNDALKATPNDPTATSFIKQTQQAKQEAAAAGAAMAAEQEKKKAYDAAIARGQQAMQTRQFPQAKAAFQEALNAKANDPLATQMIAQVDKAMQPPVVPVPKVETPPVMPKVEPKIPATPPVANPRVAFNQHLVQTRVAMSQKKYDEAGKSIAEALRLFPNDPEAVKLQQDVQAAAKPVAVVPPTTPAMPPKVEPVAPKADPRVAAFNQYLQQARALVAANRLPEANANVAEALKLSPGDAEANKLSQQIQQAIAAAMPKKENAPPPANTQAQAQQAIAAAQNLEQAHKYPEAAQAYDAASKLAPNDPNLKQRATFCRHMAEALKNRAAGKWQNAETEFGEALKLYPNDADAKAELQKAKAKKN